MHDLVGRVVDGRYRLDRLVGEGGFGAVFQATHLALGSSVAIKILKAGDGGATASQARQLAEEARFLSRLRHPNVVAALDAGALAPSDGMPAQPYLVLEWSAGETLKDWLARRLATGERLPLAEVWAIVEPLGAAVAHAHRLGIVHRDLKPANVMMEERPSGAGLAPRIIDFGIGKLAEASEPPSTGMTATASQAIAFTPAYAAPEQVLAMRTGTWTDVHALALLFVELSTGKPPYGTDPAEIRLAAVSPERPTAARFGVDVGAFAEPIARALALRPGERPAIDSLLRDLAAAAKTLGLPQAALRAPDASTRAFVVGDGASADASTMVESVPSDAEPVSAAAPSRTAVDVASAARPRPHGPALRRRVALAALAVAALGASTFGVRRLVARRTLGELDQQALSERVASIATIRGANQASNAVVVSFTTGASDGDVVLLQLTTGGPRASSADVVDALRTIASHAGEARSQIVAKTDHEWLLYVASGDRALSEGILAVATADIEAERVDAPETRPAAAAPRGTATRLAEVDAGTLMGSLGKSGDVLDVLAVADAGTVFAATLREPATSQPSHIRLHRFPALDGVEDELARARGAAAPFTYAVDGTTLFIMRGSARHRDPAFVRKVLDGISCEVQTWAP